MSHERPLPNLFDYCFEALCLGLRLPNFCHNTNALKVLLGFDSKLIWSIEVDEKVLNCGCKYVKVRNH